MEDGVTEAENLLHPVNLSPRSQAKEEEEENHEELGKTNHGGEERAHGFINHLISNLVSGGEADEGKDDKDQHEKEQRETVTEGNDEVKRDGLLGHLISNLVSPLSPKAGGINEGRVKAFEDGGRSENEGFRLGEDGVASGGGGGLINNLMSNFFHQSEGERKDKEKANEEEMVKVDEENKQGKTEEAGGIIDKIVSHLPTSLPDDAAPTTDEASILIHSIIHD